MSSVSTPPFTSLAHIQRQWIQSSTAAKKDENAVTVVSYNILASIHIKPRGYPFCPTGFRETMERHPQLMAELRHHSGTDVLCFQEVETSYFHETLLPELQQLGYDGVHHEKALGILEGVATFYRTKRFTLEGHKSAHFKDLIAEALKGEKLDAKLQSAIRQRAEYETPILLTTFRCKRTGRPLTVTNVHLMWQTRIVPDLNTLQACIALRKLKEFSPPDSANILCGDFNHKPDMPGYQLIRDGCLDDRSLQHLRKFPLQGAGDESEQESCLVDVLPDWFRHSCTSLRSAYSSVLGEEPAYTLYTDDLGLSWVEAYKAHNKLDDHLQEETSDSALTSPRHFPLSVMDPTLNASLAPPCQVRTLDYIWFSADRLLCLGVEEVVEQRLIAPFWACPNRVFPSDHLLMKASFAYI